MTAHAVLSPSGAHRWMKCPGSIQANKNKPWEQSVYALEGTTAHALVETCLRIDAEPTDFLGKVLEHGHMVVTEEMADAVGHAIDYVRAYLVDNPEAKVFLESPVYPAALLVSEQDLEGTGFEDDQDALIWGTPDIVLSNFPKECITIDYKHGIGRPVAVKDNAQIKIYHVGMRVKFGKYRRYQSVVIQPRLRGRRPVQEASLTDKELLTWVDKEVRPVIPITLQNNAPRNPGDWCHYCAADGKCDEQLKQAFAVASNEFGKVVRDPKTVTPAKLAEYLAKVAMVKKAVAGVEEFATRLLHAGVDVPGYVKSWTSARREWVNEDKLADTIKSRAKKKKVELTNQELYEVTVLSPAKMEKLLSEKGLIARKKRGEAPPPTLLDDLIGYKDQKETYAAKP